MAIHIFYMIMLHNKNYFKPNFKFLKDLKLKNTHTHTHTK